eukprot:1847084-Amphidinium_carterae.1
MLTEGGMEVGVLRRRMLAYKSIALTALSSRGGELWTQIWLLSWGVKKFRAQDVQALVKEFGSVAKCSHKRLEFMIWTVLKAFMKTTQELQLPVTPRGETGAWETVRKYINKSQHHVAWQALLEASGLPNRSQTKGVVRVMYRPDVPNTGSQQPQQQQQQQQASSSGTQHQQQQQPAHDTSPSQTAQTNEVKAKSAAAPPTLGKAMPAKAAKRVAGKAEDTSAAAKAPGLTRVGNLLIPTPPPATITTVKPMEVEVVDLVDGGITNMAVDDYDTTNVPAPLIDQAASDALDSVAGDRIESKRRRTSTSGSLVGVPSPGNIAPLSVSWTRFGLHERLTHVVKKNASGSASSHVAPWDEAPPPSLSNKDRISAISTFVQAAVSAPWRQTAAAPAPQIQIEVAPPPPVRTAPGPAPAAIESGPRTIPAPPPPQRLVTSAQPMVAPCEPPPTTVQDTTALAYVTPPLSRRALSVASPSSKYSSPATSAASPASEQNYAY